MTRLAFVQAWLTIGGAERLVQALADKIGQLEFSAIKRRAQERLGARFDPRAFHTALLADGPLPLMVLDARMNRWIASREK
jgi:uncharacterized protein (DUF885 family)